jgi:hypothetical protein
LYRTIFTDVSHAVDYLTGNYAPHARVEEFEGFDDLGISVGAEGAISRLRISAPMRARKCATSGSRPSRALVTCV